VWSGALLRYGYDLNARKQSNARKGSK